MPPDPSRSAAPLSADDQQHLTRLCEGFKKAWQSGTRWQIESCLEQLPVALRSFGLHELVKLELTLRRAAGEAVDPSEYLSRFPHAVQEVQAAIEAASRSLQLEATHSLVVSPDETLGVARANPTAGIPQPGWNTEVLRSIPEVGG